MIALLCLDAVQRKVSENPNEEISKVYLPAVLDSVNRGTVRLQLRNASLRDLPSLVIPCFMHLEELDLSKNGLRSLPREVSLLRYIACICDDRRWTLDWAIGTFDQVKPELQPPWGPPSRNGWL